MAVVAAAVADPNANVGAVSSPNANSNTDVNVGTNIYLHSLPSESCRVGSEGNKSNSCGLHVGYRVCLGR